MHEKKKTKENHSKESKKSAKPLRSVKGVSKVKQGAVENRDALVWCGGEAGHKQIFDLQKTKIEVFFLLFCLP